MVDLQELPALNKLQHQLAQRGLQVYTALAMKMPGEMSMKPYEAEVVLAVSKASDEQPPLFNLGPHRVMVSNYGGRQSPKPKPLSPFTTAGNVGDFMSVECRPCSSRSIVEQISHFDSDAGPYEILRNFERSYLALIFLNPSLDVKSQ